MRRFVRLGGIVYPNVMATKHYKDMRLYFVVIINQSTFIIWVTVNLKLTNENGAL